VGRVWRRGRKGVGLGIRLQRQRHSDTDSIPLGGFNPGAYPISYDIYLVLSGIKAQ
jgi:hypothetical protein